MLPVDNLESQQRRNLGKTGRSALAMLQAGLHLPQLVTGRAIGGQLLAMGGQVWISLSQKQCMQN